MGGEFVGGALHHDYDWPRATSHSLLGTSRHQGDPAREYATDLPDFRLRYSCITRASPRDPTWGRRAFLPPTLVEKQNRAANLEEVSGFDEARSPS